MEIFKTLQVPFHRAAVGGEEAQAVSEVIRSGWLTMGPKTFEFEREFAKYVGAQHAIAVSTGTAALHLCLEAAGVRAGDEVLLPTTTFTATGEAVTYLGARPVLVDIDPITMNIDPEDAARRITPRTKAIIPVHLAGQPCDMDEIQDLAAKHGLRVIEDAAHALPSGYRGKRVGELSEFTCFSFYATKTLTTGEGEGGHYGQFFRCRPNPAYALAWDRTRRLETVSRGWHLVVRSAGGRIQIQLDGHAVGYRASATRKMRRTDAGSESGRGALPGRVRTPRGVGASADQA
jgi:perosamine synthetase